jgi:hypothetical protein
MEIVELEQPTPEVLRAILERHHLLPLSLRDNPFAIVAAAENCAALCVRSDEEASMLFLEFPNGEPGVLRLEVIALQKRVDKKVDQYVQHLGYLRSRWFEQLGMHRVETAVPASRKQVPRVLKALGFVEETYRGVGIRNAVDYGRGPETLYLYSLTPGDVAPATNPMQEPEQAESVASEQ